MQISKNLKYFFILPGILSLAAVIALGLWGLRPGIDLAGGSLLQVTYQETRPPVQQVQQITAPLELGEIRIQPANETGYIVRTRALAEDEHNNLTAALGSLGSMQEDQFTTIGPTI